jgi:uncharacterized membrane protein
MRLTALFIASLFAAATAHAQVSYAVANVRPGDTLNVRTQPNPQAPVVQTIPFNGKGITLTGHTAQGGWVRVTYNRKSGWVNSRYLGYGDTGRYQLPANMECVGTEPFWGISLTPGNARADMNFAERRYSIRLTRAQQAMNRSDIWLLRGASRPGEMSLIIRHETCSDGMSDNRYPFSAIAMISGLDMVAGCCRVGAPR